jgi:hypothetical protein
MERVFFMIDISVERKKNFFFLVYTFCLILFFYLIFFNFFRIDLFFFF